jgi:DNA uptake protein ComE-like DNA-binding protein
MQKNLLAYLLTVIITMSSFSLLSTTVFAQTETASITPINLNTATDEEILSIPGVGDRMLREFKEYRPYTTIAQFQREIGKYVDADQVAAWQQYVFVPTNPNTASLEDLLVLPGIDEATANLIIENRDYADWAALSAVLSQSSEADTVAAMGLYWIFE